MPMALASALGVFRATTSPSVTLLQCRFVQKEVVALKDKGRLCAEAGQYPAWPFDARSKLLPVEGQRLRRPPVSRKFRHRSSVVLPEPLGPKNGNHVALIHLQTHIPQNGLLAEGLADIVYPKQDIHAFRFRPVCHRIESLLLPCPLHARSCTVENSR